jgi:uncharacterized protein involved in outer membrane biogenesis
MKKILRWVAIAFLGLVIVLVLGRNIIARKSVEVGAERITGFPLQIGAVNVGLFNGQLDVENLKLMNPPDFEEKLFVDLPKLHVDYRLGSMLSGAPHINDMLVDINRLVVVKNTKGESNAQKLKGVTSSDKPSTTKYRVDQLRVHVGTVTIKDYSRGTPTERNIPLNVNATYKDITDSTDISRLVLLTVVSQARLPDIGIKPDDLKKGLGNVQNAAGELIKGGAETIEKTTKGLFDTLKQAVPQKQ